MKKLHLKFLKWTLLVHKKCSNLTCYGDSGRYPLYIGLAKQATEYFNRLDSFDAVEDTSLVRHAFAEQKGSKLGWYTNMKKLLDVAGSLDEHDPPRPDDIQSKLESYFNTIWRQERNSSSKLSFYNMVKNSPVIRYESYLDLPNYKERKCLMQIRSSSHRLNNEIGRYVTAKESDDATMPPQWARRCEFCTTPEAKAFLHLPFGETTIEDELHVLISCPRYHEMRTNMECSTKSHLLRNDEHWKLFDEQHLQHFARYVRKIWKARFINKRKVTRLYERKTRKKDHIQLVATIIFNFLFSF